MAVKFFRCNNEKCLALNMGNFWSELPECPQCKITAKHPKFGDLIERLSVTHFDPPAEVPGYGLGTRACDPSKPIVIPDTAILEAGIPNPYHGGSGDPTAVTCRACIASVAYRTVMGLVEQDGPNDKAKDEALKLNPSTVAALERLQSNLTGKR